MRICSVVLSLNVGGQERLLLRMAHAFQERGHQVDVVTLTPGGALRDELGTIAVHEIHRREGFDVSLYARLFLLFRSLKPDVVHTHNPVPLEYAAPAARMARVRRTVHTKHGTPGYSRAALQLARTATKFVDHFVAVSADTALVAERVERPRKERLGVIENGIPLKRFSPNADARAAIRAELGIPQDAFVVGSVGRLVPEKGYTLLVKAMGPLLGERTRLIIVGEGFARRDVEAAIQELDPKVRPFVTLTGQRRDVPSALAAFDLFTLSSFREGLPLVIPEAMASGLPVVATAVGGVPDIVPKEAGVLVRHGEPLELRAAIKRMMDDDASRAKMASAARRYALERFGEEKMLNRYLALYEA